MKTITYNLLRTGIIIGLALTTFSSCKEKKDEENVEPLATCNDGIKNQGETDVDCGGPCEACQSASAKLNGVDWTAATITATNLGADLAIGGSTVDGKGFAFTVHANSVTGSYAIITGAFQTSTAATDQYAANVSGSVTISKFDTNNKKVSGTFSFTATTFTGSPGALTNGTFTNIHYQ